MGILRFLLALAVVIAHSSAIFGIKLVGGEVAVQTFFIVSGFYMALILTEKYVGANGSFSLFISNRLLKLYPIYWVMLIIAISISLISYFKLGGSEKISNTIHALDSGTLSIPMFIWYCVASVVLFTLDWFIFMGLKNVGSISFVPQAWTIGLELMFYLIIPFIIKWNNRAIFALLLVSVLIRVVLYLNWGLYKDPWSYRFFPSELAYFLFGVLAYRFYKQYINLKSPIIDFLKMSALPVVLILTITYQWMDERIIRVVYPIVVGSLIPFIFFKCKKSKSDLMIGELSYPMYMSHNIIIIVLQKMHLPILQSVGTTAAIVTVIFSGLLNEFVSKKIERYRQKRVAKVALASK